MSEVTIETGQIDTKKEKEKSLLPASPEMTFPLSPTYRTGTTTTTTTLEPLTSPSASSSSSASTSRSTVNISQSFKHSKERQRRASIGGFYLAEDTEPKPSHALYTALAATLKGSTTYYLGCWANFLAAWGATGYTIISLNLSPEQSAFLGLGYTFLTASTFTLAKTLRDSSEVEKLTYLSENQIIKAPEAQNLIGFIRGPFVWRLSSWVSFFAAVGLTGCTIQTLEISEHKKVMLGMAGLFLLSSTVHLTKISRDRMDANHFYDLFLVHKRSMHKKSGDNV
jgi:hypothetical protein